ADPHPGNFRLLPPDGSTGEVGESVDGEASRWRLGVLDFGTVDRLPDGLPGTIGDALRMTLDGDAEAVYDMLREEGFVKDSIELDPDAVLDYLLPIIEPAQAEEFTFTRSWLRTQAARIADPRSPAHQLGKQLNLPPAYLLIHRVTLSTIGVLCQLGATVRLRDELESWLPGFVLDDASGPTEGAVVEEGAV
ncbi:MAG TPA: ABC transporter ATP-binding protein, partial [Streptomyces sp.]|nr:ABC transporter ATP-binding protein [Streptomyces sp.]